LVAKHRVGFKPPSYNEIRVKYLKQQVEKTNMILEEHKLFWKKKRCMNGWTDRIRTILNFLVNSPRGTIIKIVELGNSSNYHLENLLLVTGGFLLPKLVLMVLLIASKLDL